ncbi:MAG: riboflavin synthase [Miniphocaeibacter sp.]|jgi:riboflavin synthase|uniref:riboflavin synthase n=1 Tax=Miniphocaeibacter sp. TaxID=3100973 RepID=UPI0017AC2E0E|nr:riboflavin synthase [Gallicola sp.]
MFTGIIEEIGKIDSITRKGNSLSLRIKAEKIMSDISIGDSIAVNGICLTVTEFTKDGFCLDSMRETLEKTSLKNSKVGDLVNLERAMTANGRFGGHIVTGHIDGVGKIVEIKKDEIATWYRIESNKKIMQYIIEKGSIAIDGVSLTIVDFTKDSFRVSVIPHTFKETILSNKKIGSIVNLENDCVGKYIERILNINKEQESNISREFLLKHGF